MIKSSLFFDTNPTIGDLEIIPYESGRVSLTFFAPQAGTVTLNTESGYGNGQGIVLSPGMQPVYLDVIKHGEVVRKAWRAKYTAGASPVSWVSAYG